MSAMKDKSLPSIRVTESDDQIVRAAADKKSRTITDWIRLCAVTASKKALADERRRGQG